MNSYQAEQLETIEAIRSLLAALPSSDLNRLRDKTGEYLAFRHRVDAFLSTRFSDVCTRHCYQNRLSACCSKDGIITFFGDAVINLLFSDSGEIDHLVEALGKNNDGFKCIYLSRSGCMWRIKPIVCEMFICDPARETVFDRDPALEETWKAFEAEKKRFTWPDRPVLFDDLEKFFMDLGCRTALMYMHNSPGLLRVKKIASEKREFYNAR